MKLRQKLLNWRGFRVTTFSSKMELDSKQIRENLKQKPPFVNKRRRRPTVCLSQLRLCNQLYLNAFYASQRNRRVSVDQ